MPSFYISGCFYQNVHLEKWDDQRTVDLEKWDDQHTVDLEKWDDRRTVDFNFRVGTCGASDLENCCS
ncbi:MAG: hypothetical protein AB2693_23495 [Candidatus Thiodiazotropha sp.]